MRILMTTDTVGGVWTFTKQLTMELLGRGHSVALVSFGRAPSAAQSQWAEATLSVCSAFCYMPSEIPLEWMQNNDAAYGEGAALLLSVADGFQPDIFLTSQFCFGKLPIPVPRVVVAHSDVLSWARACRSTPLPSSPWLHRYVTMASQGLDAASAVVAPTHWMLTALASSFTLPQHAVVILNGRSLSFPADCDSARVPQGVSAGRLWDEAKNLQILTRIQSPLPLVVAGSTEMESSRAAVEHGNINFVGELNESELFMLFEQSALYICTSVYEPFGLAPLEAALCGCAVVANDIPSLREVWGDCATFFHDEASLSTVLHKLTDPTALRAAQMRSHARAEMFTPARMTERYLNLFTRLLRCPSSLRSCYAA